MLKIRVRVLVGVMIFLGYFLLYLVRYNLSVHIVDMAHLMHHTVVKPNDTFARTHQRSKPFSRLRLVEAWDDWVLAIVFAAYHIGFCICFPIFHNIGDRLGPTWVPGIAGMTSGILQLLTPAAAYKHFWVLFVVRFLTGFCAGSMQPSMVQLLRHWVPPIERNHFIWAYCGITTGTCTTFVLCAAVQYYCRWSIGFYISGGLQILWAVTWIVVVTDYPEKHPFISDEELQHLKQTIGNIFTIKITNRHAPWKLILRSVPFWAVCVLNFGYAWMIIALCIHGPLYYSRVAGYTIYQASVLTALPFLLRLILGTITLQTYHWYKYRTDERIKNIRKYLIILSHVVAGSLVMGTWFTKFVPGPRVLTIAVTLTAAGMDLTLAFCYELSPNYANSINTVIRIIGNVPGIIVSLSVGQVTYKYKTTFYVFRCHQILQNLSTVWKHIWCSHGTVLMLSGIVFLIWGNQNVQPWNSVRTYSRTRRARPVARSSRMSNIIEVEESDDSSYRQSTQHKKNSFLYKGPFKMSQTRV